MAISGSIIFVNKIVALCISASLFLYVGKPADAAEGKFDNYSEFSRSTVPKEILWKVLARNGKSKDYTQVLALDGGTIGIANFAVGGLSSLYRLMDTQKYFGKSRNEMITKYSSGCRPGKHRGNDTGWGCYSKKWWRSGMRQFVRSRESEATQDEAWLALMKPTVELAIGRGWRDSRSLAIATGIANSLGHTGFSRLAERHRWQSERVLAAYVGNNAHRKRRKDAINAAFPH